ncbi:manganese efflux pump MntP family protein [Nocardioides sp. ChNu-99]|uniref:manganese efflux pump MntP n=1 Tax=Nocardioides sp. ChNu-99 TaxID=2839897 RepID=UPI0024056323|nr:manganese efflux pump MntP family protein [Nocardioides sp. ChNu-99]MDF9716333.1 manganese efflux pump MntP family protein [Nocardioides sp. ChNu-99]
MDETFDQLMLVEASAYPDPLDQPDERNPSVTTAELIVLAFALAMDAVAVSVAQGLRMHRPRWRDALFLAGAFGLFQAVMPLGGWVLSFWFAGVVSAAAPWIAFVLLAVLGGLMIKESFSDDEDEEPGGSGAGTGAGTGTAGGALAAYAPLTLAVVVPLAVATSIDAAAVGVTFGVLDMTVAAVVQAVVIIGVITFALSLVAVFVGSRVGERLGTWAELVGGVILVLIGLRILLDHLGVLG